MGLSRTVGRLNVDKMSNAEVYAVWGTTEEEHLGKMFALIDEENAKVTGATRRHVAKAARFAGRRAFALHKAMTVKALKKKKKKKN